MWHIPKRTTHLRFKHWKCKFWKKKKMAHQGTSSTLYKLNFQYLFQQQNRKFWSTSEYPRAWTLTESTSQILPNSFSFCFLFFLSIFSFPLHLYYYNIMIRKTKDLQFHMFNSQTFNSNPTTLNLPPIPRFLNLS